MKRVNHCLTVVLVLALIAVAAGPVVASSLTKAATLTYRDIRITLDGQEIRPTDANGNEVEPFIIDGTTYLPVRGVASALGLDVGWDDEANTVALLRRTEGEAHMYQVDYSGKQTFYLGARDAYPAGAEVKLYFDLIATDTDYTFLLDGERMNVDYDDSHGYVITFTMPEHDVKLECITRNTMVYIPPQIDTLSFDSFDGGGPTYEIILEDPSIVSYESVRQYDKPDHEQMTGAGYTVTFAFTGLKPGQTTLTVQARSPIADNFDAIYTVLVDEDLQVSLVEERTVYPGE